MQTDLQVIESAVPDALTAPAIKAQVQLIQSIMKDVMIPDTHYGVIPGTGTKPTLLKAGAEKLLLTFRLDPQYESTEHFFGDHLMVRSKCTLYHQTSGRRMGSGEGSCSTKESKYAYRKGQRLCPQCGKETIIKGKPEYGGGWLCYGKKGGCGAKWPDGALEIEGQSTERVANEDLADQYNTVLKMANKRSLIAAVLNVTAASDIFTQDIEDMPVVTSQPVQTEQKPLPKGAEMLAKMEQAQADGVDAERATASSTGPQTGYPQQGHNAPEPIKTNPEATAAFVWRAGKPNDPNGHYGESIVTIPEDYLTWYIKNGKISEHVERAALELDRRRGQGVIA